MVQHVELQKNENQKFACFEQIEPAEPQYANRYE